jgi:Terminase large subunit, T4likevirus-type, N-terminal
MKSQDQSNFFELNLHEGQQRLVSMIKRFSVVLCSRRFGKTTFIEWLVHIIVQRKWEVAVFSKEAKDVVLLFRDITINYAFCIEKVNTTGRVIYFKNGARMDFFSVANKGRTGEGRGRKYHLVIYDEVQKIDNDVLEEHFTSAVLPALTDYKGKVMFFGTPNGKNTYLYSLAKKGATTSGYQHDEDFEGEKLEHNAEWAFIRMPTTANPLLDPAEIQKIKNEMDELTQQQEFESRFVNYGGTIWCYSLKDVGIQKKTFVSGLRTDFTKPLYFSFDFNKEPMTALCMQKQTTTRPQFISDISIVKEFKLGGSGTKASIYDTCQAIREWIFAHTGTKIGKWYEGINQDGTQRVVYNAKCYFAIHITGDASGNTGDGRQRQPETYYQIIKDELGLTDLHFHVPKRNPFHAESFIQVNRYLQMHPHLKIDQHQCPNLRNDMLRITANPDRTIAKKAGEKTQADLLDNLRYILWNFCNEK